uniref:Large polyvalent protein associated domain-containing protein n=1 Tax=Desulfobacca acetoxidans TaxID=60893 RepID=A0A7C3V4J5_9BACT
MPQEEGPLGGITDDMLSLLKSPLPMEEKKAEPVAVPQMEEKHGITPEMWSIFQTPPPAAPPAAPVPAAAKSVPEETPEEWAARIERQFRRERQAFEPPVERSLPGEVAASIGRGVLGIAKLPFEVAKIVGADVLGSQTAKRTLEPILWKFEEAAQSPLLRPSTSAGKPIELDRILEDPSGVAQQIAENVTNPSFWAAQVPEAALSMVPFFAGNLGARIAGQAFKYGKAIKAIQASEYLSEAEKAAKLADIGEKLARLGTIGGYGAGMAMEATQAEEQLRQYEEESGKRVNWGPRVLAILGTGLVSGSLEALSMERIFFGKHGAPSLEGMVEKLFEGKGGSILARKVLDSIATEGTTEGAQQIVQNAFAKIGYNPDQKLTEGVVESILIGAAVGGLAGNAEIFHEAVRQYAPYLKELKTRAEAERQARLAALPEFMPIYRTTPTAATAEREFIPVPTEAEEAAARRAEEERVAALPETSPIYRTGPAPGVPMEPLPAGAPPVVPLRGLEADILKEPGPEPTEVSPTKPMDFTGRRPGWPAETLDLERRLDSLLRLVDEEDDPRAAREIHNLLLAHRAEVEAALTPPQTAQPGMLPVIRRVDELYRRVEETGDVEAARELHHLLVGNRERLTGMTREQLRRLAEQPLAPSAEEVMQVDQTPTIAPTEPSEVPPPAAPPQAPTPPAGEVPSAPPTPPLAVPAAPEAPAPAATTETKAQIEGAGQGKAEFSPGVLEGMQAWLRNQIYIDDAGNYRSKETREIVPYNRELKQTFPQTEGLTEAAKRQFPEIVAELKANEEARRQLLQNRVEMPPPEAPPVPPVPEAKAPTKEELSLEDQIEELKREIDKKKEELAKYVQTPEVQGQVYGISPALPHITIGSQVPSKSELLDAAVRKMEVEYGRGKPSDVQQGEAVGGKEPATSVGTEAIEAAQEFRKKFGITKGSQEGVKDVLKFRLSVPPKTPPGKGLSLKEKAAIVLEQFKGLPEEHVYLVLRALPDAAPNEVAAMVQYPELFDKVLRGEMALSDREFQAKRQDEGFQWALPGTGVGGLFEAPPERPAGTEPKKSTKYQLTKEENLARGREVMEKVISEKTDVPVGKVLTQGMVEAAFPGAEVRRGRLFEGYRVLLPHMEIGILLNGDIQIPDIESLRKAGYREEDLKDLHEWVAAGHWRTIPGGGVITIAKGLTPLEAGETLRHETFHAACDLVLSDKERRAILQKYGDWETAARAYEEWVPERRPNTLFQKILDFFRRIYEAFRPTYESVFEKIHRGEVWGRKPREVDVFGLPLRFKVIKEADETIERYRERYLAPSEPAEPRGIVEKARGIKASLTEKAMRFYEQVVDKWAAWERLERRALQAGAKVPAGELITTSLSFMRGVEGRVRQALTGQYVYQDKLGFEEKRRADGFTGDELVRKGPSFQVRLEPLRELAHRRGMKTAEVMDNFEVLLVAQRDLELAGEFGNRLPDEIKGVHPEESREVAAALLRKYGDDFKVLQEVSGSLREWSDEAILQPLLQVGIINEEAYQTIKAKNQLYVPFKRLLDETNDYLAAHLGAAGVKGKVLHEIKGSEKQILSPLQTWIELAYKAQWAYARNKVYRAAYMIGQAYEEAGIKELPPKWIPVKSQLKQEIDQQAGLMPFEAKFWARSPLPPEPGCVPYYRDGVRRWLKLPPDLYNAAQNFTPAEMGMLMQIARVPADLLRSGAILVPEFSLGRNPVRDMIQAWVFSRFGFNPFKWFRDAALLVSKNPETLELRRQWEAGGGALATLAESFVAPEKISADYLKGKESKVNISPIPCTPCATPQACWKI